MNSNSCTTHLATFQITFLISNYLVWEQKCQIEALKLQLTETIVILSWCRKHLTGQAIYNSSLFVTLTWKKSLIGPAAYLMKNMRIQNEFLYCLRSSQTTLMLSCSQLPQKILTILNWGKYLDRVRYVFPVKRWEISSKKLTSNTCAKTQSLLFQLYMYFMLYSIFPSRLSSNGTTYKYKLRRGEGKVISKFLIEIEWQSSRRARLLNESFLPVTESFVEVINEFRDSNYYHEKRWKLDHFWRALSENHVPLESFHTFA